MRKVFAYLAIGFVSALVLSLNIAQAQTQVTIKHDANDRDVNAAEFRFSTLPARVRPQKRAGFSLMPASAAASGSTFSLAPMAASPTVVGSGLLGRLTKWTGFTSSNSVIGNSTIFEDKFGMVGIGTDSPTSRLTVAGMIETLGGGLRFPDGTIQATSATGAFFSIPHNATLTGNGTTSSPLGVAVPLSLSGAAFGNLVTVTNTDAFGNGMLVQAGPGGTGMVVGGGNSGSSQGGWGMDVRGGASSDPSGTGGIAVRALGGNSDGTGGPGVDAAGGGGTGGQAGPGVRASGGASTSPGGTPGAGVEAEGGIGGFNGAAGVEATGGNGNNQGGFGVDAAGGNGNNGKGGDGLRGIGGTSSGSNGGNGVTARGGQSDDQTGGHGVSARGGDSDTEIGGHGIFVSGGTGPMGNGLAGKFEGDVEITGNLNVTGTTKNFKIDHPLDPENKYLYHAAIESSEALNVYSGNVTTNARGEAIVSLPDWFDAMNRDLRYQLTVIGTFAQAIVAEKARNNRFTIRTNTPNVEVSWQVTGVRSDRAMLKHPFKAEENKPERERGSYLHPELYDQPEERGVESARNPESKKQPRQQREQPEPVDGKIKAGQPRQ